MVSGLRGSTASKAFARLEREGRRARAWRTNGACCGMDWQKAAKGSNHAFSLIAPSTASNTNAPSESFRARSPPPQSMNSSPSSSASVSCACAQEASQLRAVTQEHRRARAPIRLRSRADKRTYKERRTQPSPVRPRARPARTPARGVPGSPASVWCAPRGSSSPLRARGSEPGASQLPPGTLMGGCNVSPASRGQQPTNGRVPIQTRSLARAPCPALESAQDHGAGTTPSSARTLPSSVHSRCVFIAALASTSGADAMQWLGVTTSAYSTLRYLTLHTYIVRANRRVGVTSRQ
ncbi:uncharacterized protein C8Q71DRAFT_396405 [Rhodofomes roseus]|uniref:Uncharacterized protein n=1 Tax=Rhodofomes roseus TaxID=34475 RepID=A0ABQ8JZD0_9APHY|nr:uncharacterized protein C8Q71DRAFT_396405 [Rhodofomes roseus]KAH9829656.1 hypothetical protein C8Q71DRAFT_396405 [Rhodofomes roseus]